MSKVGKAIGLPIVNARAAGEPRASVSHCNQSRKVFLRKATAYFAKESM
jgi:hypothetical protein